MHVHDRCVIDAPGTRWNGMAGAIAQVKKEDDLVLVVLRDKTSKWFYPAQVVVVR